MVVPTAQIILHYSITSELTCPYTSLKKNANLAVFFYEAFSKTHFNMKHAQMSKNTSGHY
ncbi:hypothetical protein LSAJ160_260091 [Latilactobacillus sakei]|nr:hypothetical protein LSAJ160_260091 [Latilactobacillus sakei]